MKSFETDRRKLKTIAKAMTIAGLEEQSIGEILREEMEIYLIECEASPRDRIRLRTMLISDLFEVFEEGLNERTNERNEN